MSHGTEMASIFCKLRSRNLRNPEWYHRIIHDSAEVIWEQDLGKVQTHLVHRGGRCLNLLRKENFIACQSMSENKSWQSEQDLDAQQYSIWLRKIENGPLRHVDWMSDFFVYQEKLKLHAKWEKKKNPTLCLVCKQPDFTYFRTWLAD